MAPLIYFCRHGQTDWNVERRLQGQWDTALNETGLAQATENGRKLAKEIPSASSFDFVASPLSRTCETMRRVRAAMGLEPDDFRRDPLLKEICFGEWESHTFAELERVSPGITDAREADKWNYVAPGPRGESYAMLAERVQTWFSRVTLPTVCVTHGGVMRCIFRIVRGDGENEAAAMNIPQNRILRLADGRLDWI